MTSIEMRSFDSAEQLVSQGSSESAQAGNEDNRMMECGSQMSAPSPKNIQIVGHRWVCCDMLFERVQSRAVQGILLLLMMMFAVSKVTGVPNLCYDEEKMPFDCDPDLDAADFAAFMKFVIFWAQQLEQYTYLVVIALLNSMYFLRQCGPCVRRACRIISILIAVMLTVKHTVDASSSCVLSPAELCEALTQDPIAKFFVSTHSADLLEGKVSCTILGKEEKTQKACQAIGMAPAKQQICTNTAIFTCTCGTVETCLQGFAGDRYRRKCQSQATAVLVWLLLLANIWDLLKPVVISRFDTPPEFILVDDMKIYMPPFDLHLLARRVPLCLFLAFIVNMALLSAIVTRIWPVVHEDLTKILPTELFTDSKAVVILGKTILVATAISQPLIFFGACCFNLKLYREHSALLGACPWESLQRGDTGEHLDAKVLELLYESGISLPRFKTSPIDKAPFYFGLAWASLTLASTVSGIIAGLIPGSIVGIIMSSKLRKLLWNMVVRNIAKSVCALFFSGVGYAALYKCVWGTSFDEFPSRPGVLAVFDVASMVLGMASTLFLALVRVGKSLGASMIGLLKVTVPGVNEMKFLKDDLHDCYLAILWLERFRLEVDRGGIPVKDNTGDCKALVKDTCICSCKFVGAGALVVSCYLLTSFLFTGKWELEQSFDGLKLF